MDSQDEDSGDDVNAYVLDLWRSRFFWLSLVKMDLENRYRRSFLGIGWSLLHPIGSTIVLCAVFHKLFHIPIREFVPYLMTGLAWWGFVTGSIGRGCQCFVEAESYIRQHPLPMAVYPLRTALGAMIHLLIALGVVLLCTWAMQGFGNLATLPVLLFGLFVLLLFGWGIAVLAGYVNTIFRDVQHITDIVFQITFYLTPIMYPTHVLERARLGWVLKFNPLYHMLKIIRDPLVAREVPSLQTYAVACTTTIIVVITAALLLKRIQRKIILYL